MVSLIWLKDVLIDWLIILICLYLGVNYIYLIPICIIVIGNRQHALALMGHEATHKLVSKNKIINYWLGNLLCFAPILLPWYTYKKFHMAHHRWLGTDKDPEVDRKNKAGIVVSKASKRYIFWRYIADLCGLGIPHLRYLSLKKTPSDILVILPVHILLISTALYSIYIPIMWYIAMSTSLLATSRLRIWYEHVGTNNTHKIEPTLLNKILFLPHNAAYHYEHHKYPGIKYHLLPKIKFKNRIKIKYIHL